MPRNAFIKIDKCICHSASKESKRKKKAERQERKEPKERIERVKQEREIKKRRTHNIFKYY